MSNNQSSHREKPLRFAKQENQNSQCSRLFRDVIWSRELDIEDRLRAKVECFRDVEGGTSFAHFVDEKSRE